MYIHTYAFMNAYMCSHEHTHIYVCACVCIHVCTLVFSGQLSSSLLHFLFLDPCHNMGTTCYTLMSLDI